MSHFTRDEFACKCCGECRIRPELFNRLNLARDDLGEPIIITSGFRCKSHNERVGGSFNSSHLQGYAADIHVHSSSYRYRLLQALEINGFNRFGIGKSFIHIDCDPSKPQKVIWTY